MYQAIVARIKTKPHPNADRIQLGDVLGNQVVVGLNTQDGELGIYFPTDGVLSHEFCLANNLYNKAARAVLNLGDGPTGFFDVKRRIRTQRFRGEKSDGLWMPLTCVEYLGWAANTLTEGMMFDSYNGSPICEKWYSKKTSSFIAGNKSNRKKGEIPGFPKHMDTDQWSYYKDQIDPLSIITISEKLHGTSHRVGLVLDDTRKWWQFWKPRWTRLDGSRNVILGASSGQGYYGSDEFRTKATPVVGRKGEVLFGEIVGWVDPITPIMPSAKIDKKELPDEYAQYGDSMDYIYGQTPGHCEFFVYRIVQFNEDGEGVELSDPQVRKRAEQLGYRCPPLLYCGVMGDGDNHQADMIVRSLTGDTSLPSLVDPDQIREGVIVRVDSPDGHTKFYKSKSFAFKLLEGIIKSNEDYQDVEEVA